MFGDGALTFREFILGERLPLATVHDAVLEFLRGRDDAVLFGAQAVNAYVDESRMTQDVDILSTRAAELANEIRNYLHDRFKIAVRVRRVNVGIGYRVYQIQKPRNRRLADIRQVDELSPSQIVEGVRVLAPAQLIAEKTICAVGRLGSAKGFIDQADLRRLLLRFPNLKRRKGPVRDWLKLANASREAIAAWENLVKETIVPEDPDTGY